MEGKIEKILQEVVLGSKDQKNLKDVNTTPSCYNGYTLLVENGDGTTGQATIVDYTGGHDRVATIEPPLSFVPIPDQARFTLKKAGVAKDTTGLLGSHPFRHKNQVFVLGQGEGELKLDTSEGYYNSYTFEVRHGKTLLGSQRIYEYWPAQRKVVLEGPLSVASGKELQVHWCTEAAAADGLPPCASLADSLRKTRRMATDVGSICGLRCRDCGSRTPSSSPKRALNTQSSRST